MEVARLSRYGAGLGIAVALAATGLLLYSELNRPIEQIRIEGHLSNEERRLIQQELHDYADARILSTSLDAVVEQVNALGWPQNVTVRRQWPDTLILRINKQGVIAHWNGDQLLTNNGRVIVQADVVANLPKIRAEAVEPETALLTLQLLDELARNHGLRIAELEHSVDDGWSLLQNDAVSVRLGRADRRSTRPDKRAESPRYQLAQRYDRFLRVRAQLPVAQANAIEYADVRYANGVALKPRAQGALMIGQAQSARTATDEQ